MLSDLIEQVLQITQYPILSSLSKELGQDVTSALRTATPDEPGHVVLISDKAARYRNYLLAVQCLLILMKYKDGKTLELVPNPVKISALEKKLFGGSSIASVQSRMSKQFLQTLLEQLNSLPIEILAMYLIPSKAPELIVERAQALADLSKEVIAGAIDPLPLRNLIPKEIYQRNFSMNAALACTISDLIGDNNPVHEFTKLGFYEDGRKLYAALRNIASAPASNAHYYQTAVDAWGALLRMSDWYRWVEVTPKELVQ